MQVTDELVNGVLRDMGVDVDKKKPPHWIQDYYIFKSDPNGAKQPDGFICSRCGKKSWGKKEACDGCGSVMANSDKILSNLQKVADVEEVKHGEWFLLDDCANEGVYCSVCHKKVYKKDYANQKLKSPRCPNCGAKMDGGKVE